MWGWLMGIGGAVGQAIGNVVGGVLGGLIHSVARHIGGFGVAQLEFSPVVAASSILFLIPTLVANPLSADDD